MKIGLGSCWRFVGWFLYYGHVRFAIVFLRSINQHSYFTFRRNSAAKTCVKHGSDNPQAADFFYDTDNAGKITKVSNMLRDPSLGYLLAGISWPLISKQACYGFRHQLLNRQSIEYVGARNQVFRAWRSNYIPKILWDIITYPCLRYRFMTQKHPAISTGRVFLPGICCWPRFYAKDINY